MNIIDTVKEMQYVAGRLKREGKTIAFVIARLRDIDARIPDCLSAVVQRLLAKSVETRYQSSRGLVADRFFYGRCRLIRSGCRQRGESYDHAERGCLERIPQHRGHPAHACAVNRRTGGDRRSPGLQEGPAQTITDFHVHFL